MLCRIPIDVSDYESKCEKKESPKLWIADLNLFELDRNDLLDLVGWMSDSIINAAQKLLKRQFPSLNGLQDVTLGNVMSYRIQTKEFLQILHSSNHWLTISTIGVQHPSVQVYDSLYDSIPVMVKAQIASLLCTSSKKN